MITCNILVIDDDESILDVFEYFLEYEGYMVNTLPSGKNIINEIQSINPNVILIDALLRGENGKDLCRHIKQHDSFSNIPIIIMSASPDQLVNYQECFADDVIDKPFHLTKIKDLIEEVIKIVGDSCKKKNSSPLN